MLISFKIKKGNYENGKCDNSSIKKTIVVIIIWK